VKKNKILSLALLVIFAIAGVGCSKKQLILAGGFTTGDENGLSLFSFDPGNGHLKLISGYDGGPSPSLFSFSEKRDLVYVIDEVMDFDSLKAGGLTTLTINKNGSLSKSGELPVPLGGPCHISLSKGGGFLFIASYSSSSVAVVKIGKNGIPEIVTDTIVYAAADSLASHPHMIAQDPLARHIYLSDLGLDRVLVYDLDSALGKLIRLPFQEIPIIKGSGPRHFIFNAGGTKMYLMNELGSTIITFEVAADGRLNLLQTIKTTADSFSGHNQSAEVAISMDGKFLYGSNRGENSIVVFKIGGDGLLSLAGSSTCGGDWPRNFILDPAGKYLLSGNQKSDDISVFRINTETGIPEGPVFKASLKAPAYLGFLK
jgi:6-phosphogluconolactonase